MRDTLYSCDICHRSFSNHSLHDLDGYGIQRQDTIPTNTYITAGLSHDEVLSGDNISGHAGAICISFMKSPPNPPIEGTARTPIEDICNDCIKAWLKRALSTIEFLQDMERGENNE